MSAGIRLQVTGRDGAQQALKASIGKTLMEELRDQGMGVAAICGGQCACGTCHCFVDAAWQARLPAKDEDEADLLESLLHYNPAASRLGCQIELTPALDGLEVTVAPEE